MLRLMLDKTPLKILALGAHCDDIEIGCGGTIRRLAALTRALSVRWVVFTGSPDRQKEAKASARHFLRGVEDVEIELLSFRESFLPWQGQEVKEHFELIRRSLDPDLIFTHFKDDAHQDHRLIADLTWNTFRRHLILEYEIPKYEGDLSNPNLFSPLPREMADDKVKALCHFFASQTKRAWFSHDTFYGQMRLRGIGCHAESGFAEAFYCRKIIL